MPTILRLDGLRVVIYTNDHMPEHVHVISPAAEALFYLGCPDVPPSLRENYRFDRAQISWIAAALLPHAQMLCGEWSGMHG